MKQARVLTEAEFKRLLAVVAQMKHAGRNRLAIEEHAVVAAAIAAGQPEVAEQAMRVHLRRSHENMLHAERGDLDAAGAALVIAEADDAGRLEHAYVLLAQGRLAWAVGDAATALDWGLVAEVADDPGARANEVAAFWLQNATAAFGTAKRLIRSGADRPFAENLDDEAASIGARFDTPESAVRVAAFAAASTKNARKENA